jgi:short-subunit dehydrogenase
VTQAVLTIMRAQQSGHIIQISSIGGVWTVPTGGLYHASKWGLEGFSQTLAAEVKGLGIKVTIIEPGGFATEFGTTSAHRTQQLPSYDAARASLANFRTASAPGGPQAIASALLRSVDAAEPPLRVFLRRRRPAADQARICRAHRDLGKLERRVAGSARQFRQSLRWHLT